jgi:hypothetical protein
MAKENKKLWLIPGIVAFVIYVFIAARPIHEETILKPRWITSLELNYPVSLGDFSATEGAARELLPFNLGDRYGYVGEDGRFAINHIRSGYVSIAANNWAEYESLPSAISVMNTQNELVMNIEQARGYPLFLDNRVFIVGNEQNSITELGGGGEELWTYDFPAPITCVDASNGYLLAGTLDGAVLLLDSSGIPAFTPFEPGGSRLSVIVGCAISRDASRLAIVSGIDNQRFLLMEYAGDTYRVVYHEFLGEGFRRPVHISFADNDSKVAFEREGGLGIYDISSRSSIRVALDGEIAILDNSGGDKFLFAITSQGPSQKRFIAIRYPSFIVTDAPFKSDTAFFARRGNTLYIGGDLSMASLELEKR